ncbi:MAG TPA: DUF4129 domain-containing protein [Rectinemataceae bacterium]|nr:DUF4129 domain-containing protein [Rectinemataceae bacterium]
MKASLVFLAAMDLMKLHLVASYFFLAFGGILALSGGFPYVLASLAFFFSLALSRFLRRKNLRVLFFGFFEVAAFALSFMVIYIVYGGRTFDVAAILPRNDSEMGPFFFLLAVSAAFWLRAAWLEMKKADHEFCAARFDEGIALFLAAFCLTALIQVKNPLPPRLVIPYFLFGILALGMSKNEGATRGGLSPNSRSAMVASVALVFVLAAAGVLLLIPALTEPAKQAAAALKSAAVPVFQLLLAILKWFFKERSATSNIVPQDGDQVVRDMRPEAGEASSGTIMMWIILGVLGAFALALLCGLLFQLFRFLFSRTKKAANDAGSRSFSSWIRSFARAVAKFLARVAATLARLSRHGEYGSAALALYARLLSCGRFAGLPRGPCETAREYSLRLAETFPASAGQAAFIVEAVEKEAYGGLAVDAPTAARLSALRPTISRRAFLAERLRRGLRPRR